MERSPTSPDLRELILTCLDRMDREGKSALEVLCREHPEHARALRERIELLEQSGFLGDAAPTPPPTPRQVGDFRLLEPLGEGGMGIVYRAEQVSLRRTVAVKLVRPDQMPFADARQRFCREVEAVSRLQHHSIVPIYAVGNEEGVPYFAMEFLFLRELLQNSR